MVMVRLKREAGYTSIRCFFCASGGGGRVEAVLHREHRGNSPSTKSSQSRNHDILMGDETPNVTLCNDFVGIECRWHDVNRIKSSQA